MATLPLNLNLKQWIDASNCSKMRTSYKFYFGLYVEKCNYGLRYKLTRPNVAEKEICMLET